MISLHNLPNALEGEKPVLFLRRHWIEVLSILFYTGILAVIPVLILIGLRSVDVTPFSTVALQPFTIVASSVYILFVLIILFTQFTDYYLDTWIVTTERIINIEQHGLFSRLVSELHLNEIQDVTSETHGFLETFLTYGDVYIQSAAERQRFTFKNIDNPDEVKQTIIRLVQEDKIRHPVQTPATPPPQPMDLAS
jgi:hypothetical protein